MERSLGNGGIFALATFGFALALFGFQEVVTPPVAIGATLNALVVAGVMEVVGGLFMLIAGEGYLAGVIVTFGSLLIGFYLLVTGHPSPHLSTTKAIGSYELWWTVPVAYMWLPALWRVRRSPRLYLPISVAFCTLLAMLICAGSSNFFDIPWLARAAGWCAFGSAAVIWYIGYEFSESGAPPLVRSGVGGSR